MNVINGQSLYDVVIQSTGNINNLFTILSANGLNVDAIVQGGQTIDIPLCTSLKETFLITSDPSIQTPIYAKSQQNLFDLVVQYYGDISLFFQFLSDNFFEVETIPQSGQKIVLHVANTGNEQIKKAVTLNNWIFSNAVQIVSNTIITISRAFSNAFSNAFK